ncbi:MAG TPA: DUF4239 domain-containing protein [Candidatus Elarobacter sp.]|jgi:hypothetical protein|nr:DUF4239 domain-containing protein [Candidatus Elarobacter sp.]
MFSALYAIPAWLVLLVAMALAAALASAGLLAIRRAFPRVDFRANNDVGGIVLGIMGGLFTVTLAFIIAIVWQEFDGTTQRAAQEVAAASDLWHTARGLPKPLSKSIRHDIVEYAEILIDKEWRAMRTGGSSDEAENLLTTMYESVARARPANGGETNAQSQALQYLGVMHDMRHHRLEDNRSGVKPFEWAILILSAVLIVGMSYVVGLPSLRVQVLMVAALAAMIAAMFTLVFELDFPFRGDVAVPVTGWTEFLGRNRSNI